MAKAVPIVKDFLYMKDLISESAVAVGIANPLPRKLHRAATTNASAEFHAGAGSPSRRKSHSELDHTKYAFEHILSSLGSRYERLLRQIPRYPQLSWGRSSQLRSYAFFGSWACKQALNYIHYKYAQVSAPRAEKQHTLSPAEEFYTRIPHFRPRWVVDMKDSSGKYPGNPI